VIRTSTRTSAGASGTIEVVPLAPKGRDQVTASTRQSPTEIVASGASAMSTTTGGPSDPASDGSVAPGSRDPQPIGPASRVRAAGRPLRRTDLDHYAEVDLRNDAVRALDEELPARRQHERVGRPVEQAQPGDDDGGPGRPSPSA
jgi:hypothetical protein